MDHNTARWMQHKRLSFKELAHFHAIEKAAKCVNGIAADKDGNVIAKACAYLTRINDRLGAFWNPRKTEEERAAEIRAFERHVFPLWSPILDHRNDKYATSLEAQHAADLVIYRDSYTINREGGGPQATSAVAEVYA